MDITVYLPDAIGAKAKEAGLNFSGLLRAAVESELAQKEALEAMTGDAREYLLDLESEEGRRYKGRLTGTLVVEGRNGDQFFVADDERFIYYDAGKLRFYDETEGDVEEVLRNLCDSDEDFVEAMGSLGMEVTIDI